MKIKELTTVLEKIAPPQYQEGYDNVGLIVGNPMTDITGVLVCLDSTEAVILEAVARGCNLVVAHHPIVFKGLKKLNGKNYVERTVITAIKNDVAIYAIHTNLDNMLYNGVNTKIAEKLGLTNLKILAPKLPDNQEVGAGIVGELPEPMTEMAFLQFLKTTMKAGVVRFTHPLSKNVKKVAICGGAGSFLLSNAIRSGADVFVTADFKYHEFFDADGQILIADIGHFESEQYTIDLLMGILQKEKPNFEIFSTKTVTNPVNYL
jgi:dinuclear metal center YbgI/SA1388 family protein